MKHSALVEKVFFTFRWFLFCLLLSISLITCFPALAQQNRFSVAVCMRWKVEFTDIPPVFVGDDNFNDNTDKSAIGAWIVVHDVTANESPFNGFAKSGSSCTTPFWAYANHRYSISLYSTALNKDRVVVRGADDKTFRIQSVNVSFDEGSQTYVFAPSSSWWWMNIAATASFCDHRVNAGKGNRPHIFKIMECGDPTNLHGSCLHNGSEMRISPNPDANHVSRRMIIAHEMGHSIARQYTGGLHNDCGFPASGDSYADNDCVGVSHALWSIEYQHCAVNEGLAGFYAAICFNNRSGGDCWTRGQGNQPSGHFPRDRINCLADASRPGHVLGSAYMETFCDEPWSNPSLIDEYIGYANELDWIRTFTEMYWGVWWVGGYSGMLGIVTDGRDSISWDNPVNVYYSIKNAVHDNYSNADYNDFLDIAARNGVDH